MSDTSPPVLRLLATQGGPELAFSSGHELQQWCEKLKREWNWLSNSPAKRGWYDLERAANAIQNSANEWTRHPDQKEAFKSCQRDAQAHYEQLTSWGDRFHANQSSYNFVLELKRVEGSDAGSGAFAVLTGCDLEISNRISERFYTGIIRGFLYKNEIEWSAASHRKTLVELESEYQIKIREQQERLRHLEAENERLNQQFADALTTRSQSLDTLHDEKAKFLDELHAAKDKAFGEMATKHEANLKTIEDTFHNKLALQKPIDYWRDKKTAHVKLAKRFAWASAFILVLFGTGLGSLVYWAFGSLGPNDNPKHWQVGVTIIAAFFAIWIVRLLVRMFLSHQHLAADAAERVTMVQTYLSLSLEGQGVAPSDRSVILQQLFKSASDGLVKDDAAPPGLLEFASRQRP